MAETIGEYVAGNLRSQRAIYDLREGKTDPDFLYHILLEAHPQFADEQLRGFMRNLQKTIEREVAHG